MIGDLANVVGRGLFAGAIGTGVMTAVQLAEMRATGRPGSKAPAEAVEKVFAIEPKSEQAEDRLVNFVHFGYGTAWGAVRGVLAALGARGLVANTAHFGLVWGAAIVMLPTLGISPPITKWGGKQVASDLALHAVYAAATGLAFEWLSRRSRA